MTDPIEESTDRGTAARPLTARLFAWVAGLVLVAVSLLALMHVVIRPIPPTQATPTSHFGEPCGLCHFIIDSAEAVDVS
jgi:hypothetical protein